MEIKNILLPTAFLLILPYLCYAESKSECTKEKSNSYLDIAVEMIRKAKETNLNCPRVKTEPLDCADILRNNLNTSGVFQVFPKNRILVGKPVEVFCDMETDGGGWTLIQKRGNFLRAQDYFFQDWEAYKNGFGDIEKDFCNQKPYSIRFDLQDVEGAKRYAVYDSFWIDDEDHKYAIHIKGYRGDAGDSMISSHDKRSFTTKDQDNDEHKESNCAQLFKGGWWYSACHASNLNGLYLRGKHDSYADGVVWHSWKGHHESMDTVEIKIRPIDFRTTLSVDATPE